MNTIDQTIIDTMTAIEIDGVMYATPDHSHRTLTGVLLRHCRFAVVGEGVSPHRAVTIHIPFSGRPDQIQCAIAIESSNPEGSHYSPKDCNACEFKEERECKPHIHTDGEAVCRDQSPLGDSNPDRRAENLLIAPVRDRVKHKTKTANITKCEKIAYCKCDMDLARRWHAYALAKTPWRTYDLEAFAKSIFKIRETVGLTIEAFGEVLTWVQNDTFWCANAISPCRLLSTSEKGGMRKIDTILLRMKHQVLKRNPVLQYEEKKLYEVRDAKKDWNPWG